MRDIYFLDVMSPSHHVFLMRNIIEVRNHNKNIRAITETSKKTKKNVSIDATGRLVTTTAGAHVNYQFLLLEL